MSLTSIKIETAGIGKETSEEANDIFDVFWWGPKEKKGYMFNPDMAIICVSYEGELAVAAASVYKHIIKETDDEAKAPFVNLPYLSVSLIATEWVHRRNGYGKQLVGSVVNLAASVEFDRVVADPSNDEDGNARSFWSKCGFTPVPYRYFSNRIQVHKTTAGIDPEDLGVEVTVYPEAIDRLTSVALEE